MEFFCTNLQKMTDEMMKTKVFRGAAHGGSCFAWYANEVWHIF